MSGRLPAFFDDTGNEGQMNTMRNVGGKILDNLKEFPSLIKMYAFIPVDVLQRRMSDSNLFWLV